MHEIVVAEDIAFSADAIWAIIGDFGGISKWAKLVVEETGEGKLRLLTLQGGQSFRECLIEEGPCHYTSTLLREGTKTYLSTVSVKPLILPPLASSSSPASSPPTAPRSTTSPPR